MKSSEQDNEVKDLKAQVADLQKQLAAKGVTDPNAPRTATEPVDPASPQAAELAKADEANASSTAKKK